MELAAGGLAPHRPCVALAVGCGGLILEQRVDQRQAVRADESGPRRSAQIGVPAASQDRKRRRLERRGLVPAEPTNGLEQGLVE